jgi:hypothetical protein
VKAVGVGFRALAALVPTADAPESGSAQSTFSTVAPGLSDEVAAALRKAMDSETRGGADATRGDSGERLVSSAVAAESYRFASGGTPSL